MCRQELLTTRSSVAVVYVNASRARVPKPCLIDQAAHQSLPSPPRSLSCIHPGQGRAEQACQAHDVHPASYWQIVHELSKMPIPIVLLDLLLPRACM